MDYVGLKNKPPIRWKAASRWLIPVTVATLLFGLWPLNFWPENQVHWLDRRNGVQFHRRGTSSKTPGWGVVYSATDMDIPSMGHAFEPATIEIYVESRAAAGPGLAYILSVYDADATESLVIGQWKSYLEVQHWDNGSGHKYRGIDLKDALLKDSRVLITIASAEDRTDIFVNGELARSSSRASFLGLERFRGRLLLGNSPTGQNPWAGNLYGLALYRGCLLPEQVGQDYRYWTDTTETTAERQHHPIVLYAFDEREGTCVHNRVDAKNHLTIPRTYRSLRRDILTPFWRHVEFDRGFAVDVIINVFGFVSFGFCLARCLRQGQQLPSAWALLAAILAGAVLSLSIEIAQVALPGRCSSSLDLICNTFGAGLGAALFSAMGRCERSVLSERKRRLDAP